MSCSGADGIDESNIADAVFRLSEPQGGAPPDHLQVFTLHAELEGMLLLGAFESLLTKWRERRRVAHRAWPRFATSPCSAIADAAR